jgi:hypothetical protein
LREMDRGLLIRAPLSAAMRRNQFGWSMTSQIQ